MQYKCDECNDTGSRDKIGAYFDCNACGTAATRRDLNDFVKSLTKRSTYPVHPEDVALAIHQRALAMAPKQEADHINDVVKMVAPTGWKLVPVEPTIEMIAALGWGGDEVLAVGHGAISGGIADEYAAMLAAAPAAPAAANGALTDADILGIIWKYSSFISAGNYSSTQFDCQADTLNCARAILAAAGPDSAPRAKNVDTKVLVDIATAIMGQHGLIDHLSERKTQKFCDDLLIALSGAKGN